MRIRWYGHAAFRLTDPEGPTIITDPYTPEGVGYPPIRDAADLVVISSDDDDAHCRADLIDGDPTVVNALDVARNGGAHHAAGVSVSAVEAAEGPDRPDGSIPGANGMYRLTLGAIDIAHMGDVGTPLSNEQTAFLGGADILLALAGGELTIPLPDLHRAIEAAKPKIVIPMHFRTLTYKPRNTHWIESFLAYFDEGDVDFAFAHDVAIEPEDLPDKTRVLVMDYVR